MKIAFATPTVDGKKHIELDLAKQLVQKSAVHYDKEGDEHYDIVSAYQKSMRGSDPDAALHYLARLLEAGGFAVGLQTSYGLCLRGCRACLSADYPDS